MPVTSNELWITFGLLLDIYKEFLGTIKVNKIKKLVKVAIPHKIFQHRTWPKTPLVMSLYGSESGEVILKTRDMPHDTITRSDIREIIDGWEEKFNKLTEGMRALELNTHEVHTHMDIVMMENRARESAQLATNRQIKLIQEGLVRFMETCDPPLHTFVQPCAPKMSTPVTPSGAPPKFRSDFSFASPVNQTTQVEPTRGDGGRDLNERPTHGNGNGSDTQQLTMNTSSGLNNTATRHSSSPKVPIFDGMVSAHSPMAHTV